MIVSLKKAIKMLGGQSATARVLGVKQQAVWSWINRDQKIPIKYVLIVETLLNKKVSRYELRPDIYPQE